MRKTDREHTQNHDIQHVQRPYADTIYPPSPKRQFKKKNHKSLVIVICLIVVLLVGGLGGWFYIQSNKDPLPESVRKSVNFPIYYPSSLPRGYSFDSASPKASSSLLVYSLEDSSGKAPITLTFQPLPSGFNASKVFDPKIAPAATVPIGNQYNLSVGQQSKYVIVTDDGTLIFITSPAKIPGGTIHSLVSDLRPAQ